MANKLDGHKSNMRNIVEYKNPTRIFSMAMCLIAHMYFSRMWYIRTKEKNLHNEPHQLDVSKTTTTKSLSLDSKWKCSIWHSLYFSHSTLSKIRVPCLMCTFGKMQETTSLILGASHVDEGHRDEYVS